MPGLQGVVVVSNLLGGLKTTGRWGWCEEGPLYSMDCERALMDCLGVFEGRSNFYVYVDFV